MAKAGLKANIKEGETVKRCIAIEYTNKKT